MSNRLNLPELEVQIQEYWEENRIQEEVEEYRSTGDKFYFCQGPPFTSGIAHLGHAWNHAIKDAVLRYNSMQGYDVFKRAGWDMHGLPIEVKVEEKVLGSRTKKEIEEFGIENFITECKKFAIKNMNQMTDQLKRMGVWLDWEDPYMTIDKRYMEGVWHLVKKADEKDLVYEDEQVIHWCPRCETAMAGYEVRDEYRNIRDHSIFVKAPLTEEEFSIVIWTTTPWTLPSNTGIAIHPEYEYVKIKTKGEKLILAKERLEPFIREVHGLEEEEEIEEFYELIQELKGKELVGKKYEAMLEIPQQKEIEGKRKIISAPDLVTLEEGSGCVHMAPGHGQEDFEEGRKQDLVLLSPVDPTGRFTIEPYKGKYIRDANEKIIQDLKDNKNLVHDGWKTHAYPHCWRCKTPLLLRATKQWFMAISQIKDQLLELNKEVDWVPPWIGTGRFRNWLQGAEDWCISRQRYWNTPLPIWRCECGKDRIIGSLQELCDEAEEDLEIEDLDLHRPAIDHVKVRCECGNSMHRVEDVMDVWLDSGCAPFANLGYPHERELLERMYPSNFITEGSDQTRGWFYSQLVCSAIVFDEKPYNRVLYHGFTLDEEGRKMSKSLGNVIDPFEIIENYGADVLRYYMLWASVPWEDLRFSYDGLENINRLLHIFWNIYSFSNTYMQLDDFDRRESHELEYELEDEYILSRYNSLVKEVTQDFENIHLFKAARKIRQFILEVSRFYIKLIRDRVWMEKDHPKKMSAYHTLYDILEGTSRLMAPLSPHLAEGIYQELTGERSIHFADFPREDEEKIDEKLEEDMQVVQEIIEGVVSARQEADLKLRWPIPRVIVAPKDEWVYQEYEDLILKMTNAKRIEVQEVETELIVKANYPRLGPKLKDRMKDLISALENVNGEDVKRQLEEKGSYEIQGIELKEEDLIFEKKVTEDVVAKEYPQGAVYIDSHLTDELYSEAMARELIRRIQDMRKRLDLEETQQIKAEINASEEFEDYIRENQQYVEQETRSEIEYSQAEEEAGYRKKWDIEGEEVVIHLYDY